MVGFGGLINMGCCLICFCFDFGFDGDVFVVVFGFGGVVKGFRLSIDDSDFVLLS